MKTTCAVIGSGIAGLASAIRLAAKGCAVTVYETNNYPGGKFKQQQVKGYRFDMGPSVFMLPNLVDELFELCHKNPRDYFTYSPIETSFTYFFEDGSVINAHADIDLFTQEIETKTNCTKVVLNAYLKDIETKYNITKNVFIENSLHVFSNYFTKEMVSGVANFGKIDSFKTMNEVNVSYFNDPRLVQLFNNYATYIGSNPFVAPATLNVIQHLEINTGTYIPDKGMYAMITALVKLAEEMGVTFIYNTTVEEIIVEHKQVLGIKTKSNPLIKYDRIISNMDIYYTYKKLLPTQKFSKRIINQPKSTSVVCFYWGINKQHKQLGIHNMLFAKNDKAEYDAVFNEKTISNDPSLYIFISAKHVKEDAPPNSENWFVLITAPNEQGQDWNEIVKRTRQNAITKINKLLKTDIEKHIEFEDCLSPVDIKNNYTSAFGAVYGNSSNSKFAAFLRHPNFSKKIKGLYFVGGSVHPGAGIPMCLNSAKIMDKVFV